jgi:hypothetical protein
MVMTPSLLGLMADFDSTLSICGSRKLVDIDSCSISIFHPQTNNKETIMLLWIAIIIAVLWLLGLLGSIGGGFIHLLLVVAVVVLIFHFIRGRSRV